MLFGVMASLVASFIFLGWTRLLVPKIRISPYISVYPSNDPHVGDRYRVKVVNARYRSVSDVSLSFFVQERQPVKGGQLKVSKRIGTVWSTHTIQRRRFRDKEFDNCRRVRIKSDQLELVYLSRDNPHIVVELYCRDSWSGVGRVFRQEYAGTDSFRHGSFVHGMSMNIEPYQGYRSMVLMDKIRSRDEAAASAAAASAAATSTPSAAGGAR